MGAYDDLIPARSADNPYADLVPAGSPDWLGSAVNTVTEPIVSMATGGLGAIAGGIAGLGAAAIPGLRQGIGRDVSQAVSSAMTYQPRSAGGRAVTEAISYPFEKLAEGADVAGGATAEATESPLLGTAVNTGIQSLPLLLGKRAARPVSDLLAKEKTRLAADASRNSVKDATLAAARAEGYVVPPSAIEGSFIGNRVEGVAGKAALNQEANLRNQKATNKVARREAHLTDDSPISEKTLEDARYILASPYRDVAALPGIPAKTVAKDYHTEWGPPTEIKGKTPATPAELVHDWKSTNTRATETWKDYLRNSRVQTLDRYKALREKSDLLYKRIEDAAIAAGREDLIPQLRDARVKLAKNYDVERALNLGSGDVDAQVLGRMLDRGAPLTGGLETIAKFANAFKPFSRDAAMVPAPGVSKVEGVAAATLGMVGHGAGLGWLPGGLPLLSGPARSAMLSRQKPRSYRLGVTKSLADLASRNPNALALTPALADLQEADRNAR